MGSSQAQLPIGRKKCGVLMLHPVCAFLPHLCCQRRDVGSQSLLFDVPLCDDLLDARRIGKHSHSLGPALQGGKNR